MAVPSLSTSDPSNGDSDVYTNKNLTFTFAAALDSSTVTENTFLLIDRTTNKRVGVTLTYDSQVFRVTMVLDTMLKENTSYRALIVGTDTKVTDVLKDSASGDALAVTLKVDFSIGNDQFEIDTVIGKEVDAKTLEGDLFLPTNVKALGVNFTVNKVRPKNHTAGLADNLTGDKTVKFTFNKQIMPTGTLSDYAIVDVYPLFSTDYIAKNGDIKGSQTDTPTQDFTLPTGIISIDDSVLTVTFDRSFPSNVGVDIELLDSIQDVSGLDYGGNLKYSISTNLYPEVIPPRTVKRDIRHIDGDQIHDEYVDALIHKNSMFLWERMGRRINLSSLSWPSLKYIFSATILDILEDQDYEKFLRAGTRRQLGDMNVSVDSLIGRLALKIVSATKDRDRCLHTLNAGWEFATAIKSDGVDGLLNLNRLWYAPNGRYTHPWKKYVQPAIPASNLSINRQSKTNNPWW